MSIRLKSTFTTILAATLLAMLLAPAAGECSQYRSIGKNWFSRELTKFRTYPFLDKAYKLMAKKEYDRAAIELQRLLKINPGDLKARLMLIDMRYQAGRYQKAVDQADILLGQKPDSGRGLVLRGMSLEMLGRHEDALEDFRKASEKSCLNSEDKEKVLAFAVTTLAAKKHFKQAFNVLEAFSVSCNSYAIEHCRAIIQEDMGDTKGALKSLQGSLVLARNKAEQASTLMSLGILSIKLGKLDNARKYLENSAEIVPTAQVFRQLADVAYDQKDYAGAEKYISSCIELEDTEQDRLFLANVLMLQGKYNRAAAEFKELAKVAGNPEEKQDRLMNLGVAYDKAGLGGKALKTFSKAAKQGANPGPWLAMARIYEKNGQTGKAAKALERAVEISDSGKDRIELANLYIKQGQDHKALDQLDIVDKSSAPAEEKSWAALMAGRILSLMGDYAKAQAKFMTALATGGDQEAYMALADNAAKTRDFAAQARYLQKALEYDGSESISAIRRALGFSYLKQGLKADAARQFELAVKEAEGAGECEDYKQLGFIYYAQKRYRRAGGNFEQALGTCPAAENAPTLLLLAASCAAKGGEKNTSVNYFNRFLNLKTRPDSEQAELLADLGYDFFKAGMNQKAKQAFDRTLGTPGLSAELRVRSMLALAGVALDSGDMDQAHALLKKIATVHGVSRATRLRAVETQAMVELKMGHLDHARKVLQEVIDHGGDSWSIRYTLGLVDYETGRFNQALKQFRTARQMARQHDLPPQERIKPLLGLANTYQKLGKTGMAVYYLKKAAHGVPELHHEDKLNYFKQLGYLYADEDQFRSSLDSFQKAWELENDPVVAYQIARNRRILGEFHQANATLAGIDSADLPPNYRADLLSEEARISTHYQNYRQSVNEWDLAIRIKPDAERYFLKGQDLRALDMNSNATQAFEQALELEDNTRYLAAKGYSLNEENKTAEAIETFEQVLRRDPDYLSLWEQLGYMYMKVKDNEKAVASFKKSIDNEPLYPVHTEEQKEQLAKDIYALREEVREMTRRFYATLYMTYITGKSGVRNDPGGAEADVIRSGSGLEMFWIPPKIGWRDNRILQFLFRFNWSLEHESLEFDPDSYQAAVGVRYKPLKDLNLHFGLEKLFKIGSEAEDNTMARLLFSLSDGYGYKPVERWWNYSLFYLDSAYYLESPGQRFTVYTEIRQGATFKLNESWLATPHVSADFRAWTPDFDHSSYAEAGPAVSLRYLFNGDKYSARRSSLELLAQYKLGTLLNADEDMEKTINALFVTVIFNY